MTASLCDAVLLQIELDFQDENGNSRRSHLDKVWEQSGDRPAEYKDPQVPEAGIDLYRCFWDLYKSEGIRWQDFYYYGLYTGIWFSGEEAKIIRKMESDVRDWVNKREKSRIKTPKK